MAEQPRGPGRPPIAEKVEARIERMLRSGKTPREVIETVEGAKTTKVYEVHRRLKKEAKPA